MALTDLWKKLRDSTDLDEKAIKGFSNLKTNYDILTNPKRTADRKLFIQGFQVPDRKYTPPATKRAKDFITNVAIAQTGGIKNLREAGEQFKNKKYLSAAAKSIFGLGKIASSGVPLGLGANIYSTAPTKYKPSSLISPTGTNRQVEGANTLKRFSTGILRGMTGEEGIGINTPEKNINVLGAEFDPVVGAGSMVGFVKNPTWNKIFGGSRIIEGINIAKNPILNFLATRSIKGGLEGMIQALAETPIDATDEQKSKMMIDGVVMGVGSEIAFDTGLKALQGGFNSIPTQYKTEIVKIFEKALGLTKGIETPAGTPMKTGRLTKMPQGDIGSFTKYEAQDTLLRKLRDKIGFQVKEVDGGFKSAEGVLENRLRTIKNQPGKTDAQLTVEYKKAFDQWGRQVFGNKFDSAKWTDNFDEIVRQAGGIESFGRRFDQSGKQLLEAQQGGTKFARVLRGTPQGGEKIPFPKDVDYKPSQAVGGVPEGPIIPMADLVKKYMTPERPRTPDYRTPEGVQAGIKALYDTKSPAKIVHTMPDGTRMPGPEHAGAVPGSARVVETPTAKIKTGSLMKDHPKKSVVTPQNAERASADLLFDLDQKSKSIIDFADNNKIPADRRIGILRAEIKPENKAEIEFKKQWNNYTDEAWELRENPNLGKKKDYVSKLWKDQGGEIKHGLGYMFESDIRLSTSKTDTGKGAGYITDLNEIATRHNQQVVLDKYGDAIDAILPENASAAQIARNQFVIKSKQFKKDFDSYLVDEIDLKNKKNTGYGLPKDKPDFDWIAESGKRFDGEKPFVVLEHSKIEGMNDLIIQAKTEGYKEVGDKLINLRDARDNISAVSKKIQGSPDKKAALFAELETVDSNFQKFSESFDYNVNKLMDIEGIKANEATDRIVDYYLNSKRHVELQRLVDFLGTQNIKGSGKDYINKFIDYEMKINHLKNNNWDVVTRVINNALLTFNPTVTARQKLESTRLLAAFSIKELKAGAKLRVKYMKQGVNLNEKYGFDSQAQIRALDKAGEVRRKLNPDSLEPIKGKSKFEKATDVGFKPIAFMEDSKNADYLATLELQALDKGFSKKSLEVGGAGYKWIRTRAMELGFIAHKYNNPDILQFNRAMNALLQYSRYGLMEFNTASRALSKGDTKQVAGMAASRLINTVIMGAITGYGIKSAKDIVKSLTSGIGFGPIVTVLLDIADLGKDYVTAEDSDKRADAAEAFRKQVPAKLFRTTAPFGNQIYKGAKLIDTQVKGYAESKSGKSITYEAPKGFLSNVAGATIGMGATKESRDFYKDPKYISQGKKEAIEALPREERGEAITRHQDKLRGKDVAPGSLTKELPKDDKTLQILYDQTSNIMSGYAEKKAKAQYGLVDKPLSDYQDEFDEANALYRQIKEKYPEKIFGFEMETHSKRNKNLDSETKIEWTVEQLKTLEGEEYKTLYKKLVDEGVITQTVAEGLREAGLDANEYSYGTGTRFLGGSGGSRKKFTIKSPSNVTGSVFKVRKGRVSIPRAAKVKFTPGPIKAKGRAKTIKLKY